MESQATSTRSKWERRISFGFMIFFLLLTLPLMGIGLYTFFTSISSYAQVNSYQEGRCTILSRKLLTTTVSDDSSLSGTGYSTLYRPNFTFIVRTTDGRSYQTSGYDVTHNFASDQNVQQAILDNYRVGRVYSCWYDPARPSEAVLDRDVSSGPFIFSIVFFGAGLVFFILILLYIRSSVRKRREVPEMETQAKESVQPLP
jgi:hypothetical protein